MKNQEKISFDVAVFDHGSVHLIDPLTKIAHDWLYHNTDAQWWSGQLVVEPRYTYDLLMTMKDEGFNVPISDEE